MYALRLTITTVLTLAVLFTSTQARYIWNPNEQVQPVAQPVVHENAQPPQGEHHIISLTPELPSSHNSPGDSSTKKEPSSSSNSIQDHSTSSSDPKPTSNDHKPKESKPAAAAAAPTTHMSTPVKSDTPKVTNEQQHVGNNGKSGSTTPTSNSPAPDASSITPESSSTSNETSNSSSSSSSGLVAGIVIGIIAIIGSIAAFVMVRRKKQTQRDMSPDPFTMGFGSHDPPIAYSNNNKGTNDMSSSQPYYQQQSMTHMPAHSAYTTPPSPMTPMSSAPPYQQQHQQQQQPYYAPVMEKAQDMNTMHSNGYQPQLPPPPESLGVFNVVSTYSPTLSDELDIQLGDRIEIMVEYDDGWCQGINLTRGNTKGVFPRHCVEQYPGGAAEQQQNGPPQLELGEMKRVSSMYMAYT